MKSLITINVHKKFNILLNINVSFFYLNIDIAMFIIIIIMI